MARPTAAEAGPRPGLALCPPARFHAENWESTSAAGSNRASPSTTIIPPDHFNGPVACNDQDHEYQMNQFWMVFERPVNTGGCGFDIGGRVDMMYGTDWRFGINNGLEDRIDGFHGQTYGMVIPQFYLEVGNNDLTVKVGHMAGILDYEIVAAPGNPFYSHSYSYTYGVPILVTGVMADYKLTEQFSVQAGFNRGWTEFEDNNESCDFMGGFRWQSEDKRHHHRLGHDDRPPGPQDPGDTVGQDNRFVYSLVVQQQLTAKTASTSWSTTMGRAEHAVAAGGQASWYGLNQYLLYAINTQLVGQPAGGVDARPGRRRGSPDRATSPGVRAWAGRGFAGDFYEVTAGLNWRPHAELDLPARDPLRLVQRRRSATTARAASRACRSTTAAAARQFLVAADLIFVF